MINKTEKVSAVPDVFLKSGNPENNGDYLFIVFVYTMQQKYATIADFSIMNIRNTMEIHWTMVIFLLGKNAAGADFFNSRLLL